MDERLTNVQTVLENKEFVEKLAMQEEPEKVQQMFEEQGVIISLDEVKQIGKMMALSSGRDELMEDDLEAVSGGSVAMAKAIISAITFVVAVGRDHYKRYGKW